MSISDEYDLDGDVVSVAGKNTKTSAKDAEDQSSSSSYSSYSSKSDMYNSQ